MCGKKLKEEMFVRSRTKTFLQKFVKSFILLMSILIASKIYVEISMDTLQI